MNLVIAKTNNYINLKITLKVMYTIPTIQNIILYLFLFFIAEKIIASKAELNENHISIPDSLSLNGLN